MNDELTDDFADQTTDDEFDEHEYEITAGDLPPAHWRRVELLREKMWLQEQLQDFNDW